MGGLDKSRVAALTDGIFAVAITLLAFDLKIPTDHPLVDDASALAALASIAINFALYALSFLVLGLYWIGINFQFHFVRQTDRSLIWINLFFLMFVCLVPFSTAFVGTHRDLRVPVAVYALNLLALAALFRTHIDYLARHAELAAASLTPRHLRFVRRRVHITALAPATSLILTLAYPPAAIYAYALFLLVFAPGDIDRLVRQSGAMAE